MRPRGAPTLNERDAVGATSRATSRGVAGRLPRELFGHSPGAKTRGALAPSGPDTRARTSSSGVPPYPWAHAEDSTRAAWTPSPIQRSRAPNWTPSHAEVVDRGRQNVGGFPTTPRSGCQVPRHRDGKARSHSWRPGPMLGRRAPRRLPRLAPRGSPPKQGRATRTYTRPTAGVVPHSGEDSPLERPRHWPRGRPGTSA